MSEVLSVPYNLVHVQSGWEEPKSVTTICCCLNMVHLPKLKVEIHTPRVTVGSDLGFSRWGLWGVIRL